LSAPGNCPSGTATAKFVDQTRCHSAGSAQAVRIGGRGAELVDSDAAVVEADGVDTDGVDTDGVDTDGVDTDGVGAVLDDVCTRTIVVRASTETASTASK